MKKHNFFLFGLLLFCFTVIVGTGAFFGKTNSFASAETISLHEYVISNNSEQNKVVVYVKQSDSTTIELSQTDTISDAISSILTDLGSLTEINIEFNNFTANEIIYLTESNYIFSGTFYSTLGSEIFNIPAETETNITFNNFIVSAENSPNIILAESGEQSQISINGSTFSSSYSNSYLVLSKGTNLTLNLGANINCDTNYLCNISRSDMISLEDDFSSVDGKKLYITFPFNTNNTKVISNVKFSNRETFEFVSEKNYYEVAVTLNNQNLYISSLLKVNFGSNGGEFESTYTPLSKIDYFSTSITNFPASENISKSHTTFKGWFGKIEFSEEEMIELGLNTSVWYFDQTCLENFANQSFDKSKLSLCFVSNEENLNLNLPFSGYKYDATKTNILTFLPVYVFTIFDKQASFVAEYEDIIYTLSFDTNEGSTLEPQEYIFDETIILPNNPIKPGYIFAGWFTDNETFENPFVLHTMTDQNITIYAKWQIENYSVTFVFNNGENSVTSSGDFGEQIVYPIPTREGHSFAGWFEDDETFLVPFNSETFSDNKTIYAKWQINKYKIYFNSNGGSFIPYIEKEFGEAVEAPANPSKRGNEFAGWFSNSSLLEEFRFTFSTMPSKNITVYAKWRIRTYYITFVTNSITSLPNQNNEYGSTINIPETLERSNYKFCGWFLNEDLTTPMDYETMPDQDLTLYAKWEEKESITINNNSQSYTFDSFVHDFTNFSGLAGFVVTYLVDGNWVSVAPSNAGTYDVKIMRAEDATYKSFEKVISGGLVITPTTADWSWLIALLFILAIIEFITAIFVRHMKKMKSSKTYSFVPLTFLLANSVIPVSQITLLAVSGSLALFGFILVIYELVALHRTNPDFNFDASDYDNRRNLKKISDDEDDFSTLETLKSNEPADNYTFSTSDIEQMLADPDYFNKERNKKFTKNNMRKNNNQNNNESKTEQE